MLEATFIGYTVYYFVRNNLSLVQLEMRSDLGYSNAQVGHLIACSSIAYGLGKFILGGISDRSNPRTFMPLGLTLAALCNIAFAMTRDYATHLILWTFCGLFQAMGWPPCGRILGHWFSTNERGKVFAFWNISHNLGGALIGILAVEACRQLNGWQAAFHVPAFLAILCSGYLYATLRDTPQSEGLPPIEIYRKDMPQSGLTYEKELSHKEIYWDQILTNKYIWVFALANFFVYICRYSMLDWGPTYLKVTKGANLLQGGMSVFVLELAGIPSTLLMGWLSDRLEGKRALVSLACMLPVVLGFLFLVLQPFSHIGYHMMSLALIGFFIYPPVMLLGVAGLDFSSKKAVGAAAGFIGLFGYLGRTFQGALLGYLADAGRWDAVIWFIVGCGLAACILLLGVVGVRPATRQPQAKK